MSKTLADNSDGPRRCQVFITIHTEPSYSNGPLTTSTPESEPLGLKIMPILSVSLRSHLVCAILLLSVCLRTDVMAAEQQNLALGNPVTASTTKWSEAGEAVDGNEFQDSRWCSDFPRDASRDHTQWLAVDLQAEYTIDKARILWQRSRWAKNYEIQVSADGEKWETAYSVKDAEENRWRHELEFAPAKARHVRLFCTQTANSLRDRPGVSKFINMHSVIEFEVYGVDAPLSPLRFSGNSTGKPVSASHDRDNMNNRKDQVNDGLMTTFWLVKTTSEKPWIAIDLEESSTISGLVLYWHRTPVNYSLSVSDDGLSWREIADNTMLDQEDMDDDEVKEVHRITFSSEVSGKMVKVTIQGPAKNPDHTSYILQEMIVHSE
jgi:hypothetical protein